MRRPDVPAAAAVQAGVFTRSQARAEGWSAYQVRRRLDDGVWATVLGRGLVAAGVERHRLARAWAARLSSPGSVLSHLTAAQLHGFPVADGGTHVIGGSHNPVPGLVTHRAHLDEYEVRHGLPVTTPRRTAVDTLSILDHAAAERLWAWLLSRRLLTPADLGSAVRAGFGQQGTPALLHVLALANDGAANPGEARLHRLLRAAALTGWEANAAVLGPDGRIVAMADVLFAGARLVVEFDGFAAHTGRDAFVRDRRRQNALVNAGYRVLRVTWADLIERPDQVVAEIRTALARTKITS